MIVFPNCKINLGLNIPRKREDGFHDIETVFYPVQFTDALEVIINTQNNSPVEFTGTGLTIDGNADDNLCIKAYRLLKKDFPQLPAVKICQVSTIYTPVDSYQVIMELAPGAKQEDRKSTRLNSSHGKLSRMPSSA